PTPSGKRMSQGLDGVRKAAKERRQERFTALLHHLNVDLLRDSFYALQRKASPGVDGVTWQEYETGLEDRLVDLHGRVHRGAYQAMPSSLRVYRVRVIRLWRWTLLRRSQKHRLIWTRMHRLPERWVPKPRPLHPYPERRFAASHPR